MSGATLRGTSIRLEPLGIEHVELLVAAAAGDPELYRWSPIPLTLENAADYVRDALAWRAAGTAVPYVVVRERDGVVIGSTRFLNLERWAWPAGHPRRGRTQPDMCEIGYTWYAPTAVRTAANTEAKRLMLGHAFEVWDVVAICFYTDVRNERSRAALARIGAHFDGVLRAHRLAVDAVPRDSARFSIVASEWPRVRDQLDARLRRPAPGF